MENPPGRLFFCSTWTESVIECKIFMSMNETFSFSFSFEVNLKSNFSREFSDFHTEIQWVDEFITDKKISTISMNLKQAIIFKLQHGWKPPTYAVGKTQKPSLVCGFNISHLTYPIKIELIQLSRIDNNQQYYQNSMNNSNKYIKYLKAQISD